MSVSAHRAFAIVIITLCTLSVPVSAARADSILNYWFPSIFGPPDKGPKPQETLIAPFAQNQTGPARSLSEQERKDLSSPENIVPINQPHRSNKYVADWASLVVGEALSFDIEKINDHFKKLDENFVPYGKQELVTWLNSSNTVADMTAKRQRMQAYTKTVPTLLNEGDFSGSYRWLFDVPVIVTQMPNNAISYSGQNKPQTFTKNLLVRVQIGRTKTGFREGMAIERFSVVGTPAP